MRTQDHHLEGLYGLPAFTFPAPGETTRLPEPDAVAWRIGYERWTSEEPWAETFGRFCAEVDTTRVRALIVGNWHDMESDDPSEVIEALLSKRDRLPALRSMFLGDITDIECKLSRISQTDVTPLLAGFPALEEFGVRAGEGVSMEGVMRLEFPALRHTALRRLTVESSGLPVEVVRGVGASDLPALEHLELWLGSSDEGVDCCEVADLEPILSGARLPRLRHLALRNSEILDEVAAAMASAPVVARLDVLDLSLGTLGDDGAAALLGGQPLTHLKRLDLHHNFLSEPFRQRIRQALEPAGVEMDLDQDDAESYVGGDGTVWREICVGPVSY
ncbi:STM4015 family protein [Streptomyces sp. GQFP]|uniref:STM4015 family protein n=1 Tax=Streptomyces sp. GQFP TaxID=2907545 RepID=UPI001F3E7F20|nr:STM4015 family protein [Streptomyces sp. GQFP]UIX33446.1 STM4015 family protein [Streptomyces sp. GQFP]